MINKAYSSGKKVDPKIVTILKLAGFSSRISRRKSLISFANQQKNDIASKHIEQDFDFWKSVLFIGESKFNIFNCDEHGKILRKISIK